MEYLPLFIGKVMEVFGETKRAVCSKMGGGSKQAKVWLMEEVLLSF